MRGTTTQEHLPLNHGHLRQGHKLRKKISYTLMYKINVHKGSKVWGRKD